MLRFFKKHQKLFFWITTIIIVVTFSFFGSYNVMSEGAKKKDLIVTHTLDGKSISQNDIQQLRFLLEQDHDTQVISQGRAVNLLNPGVLMNDIIKPGIAAYLLEKHFPIIQKNFETNFSRMQKASFYEHPRFSMISCKSIWMDQAPMLYSHLKEIQSLKSADLKTSLVALKLFQDQLSFPPSHLIRNLDYLQNQIAYYRNQMDPELYHTDFSLFGFHSFSEWFSEDFMDLICEYILQVAAKAESENISVSDAEVRLALKRNFQKGIERFGLTSKDHPQFFENGYEYQVGLLHLPEPLLVKTWKKVMLFEKYFKTHDTAIIHDNFTLKNYTQFAQEKVDADVYYLPAEYRLKTVTDLASFQVYLSCTAKDFKEDSLKLPKNFLTAQELNKVYPELVEQEYACEMAKISLEDMMLTIGEKDLWQWQLEDNHFTSLQKEFPVLATEEKSSEKRFEILQNLKLEERANIDKFSRKKMLLEDANKIVDSLKSKKLEKENLVFIDKGNSCSSAAIEKPLELKKQLDQAKENTEVFYNDHDQMVYYVFKLIEKSPQMVISYKKACELSIMDNLVTQYLNDKIKEMQLTNDTAKKQTEADKEKLYLKVFEPIITAIKKQCDEDKISYKKNLMAFRFYPYMKSCLLDKGTNTNSQNPYALVVEKETIKRDYSDKAIKDAIFSEKSKPAKVIYSQKGLSFYQINNRSVVDEAVNEKTEKMHSALYEEICHYLGKQVIDQLNEKHLLKISSKAE